MAKEVTKAASTAVAAYDYGEHAGAGFENRSADDLSLPFLNILQPLSPQVVDETVPGAKAGKFFNTVTGEVFDKVRFIRCHHETKFVEWVPRDSGGGIAGVHEPSSQEVLRAKKDAGPRSNKLKIGQNDLVETKYVYGLVLNDNDEVVGFAVIAAKSTNLKPVKDWYTSTLMVQKGAPVYAFIAELSTVKQSNDKGTWYQIQAKPVNGNWKDSMINPAIDGHLLTEAKNLAEMIKSGAAKVDYSAEAKPNEGGGADDTVPF